MTERQFGNIIRMCMINSFGVAGLVTLGITIGCGWGALGVIATCACFATAKLIAS